MARLEVVPSQRTHQAKYAGLVHARRSGRNSAVLGDRAPLMMMMEADSSLKLEDRPGMAPTIHDFDIMKPISRGAFGKVFLCHRKDAPEKTLAVKVMKKSELVQKNMVDQVRYKHPAASF